MSEATDRLHPILRDLWWAVTSPCPLIPDRPELMHWPDDREALYAWLTTPQVATRLIARLQPMRHRRLGQYFEALWLSWLAEHPHWTVGLSHFPVRQQGRTLGEIDVIVRNQDSADWLHLELAVKFYLRINLPGVPSDAHWLGPGLQDSLQRKFRHMTNRQLPLGRHELVSAELGQAVARHRILLRGRFFEPLPTDTEQIRGSPVSDQQAHWCTLSACRALPERTRFLTLQRSQWLTGPSALQWTHRDHWCSAHADLQRPVQVWVDYPDSGVPCWMFVVPDEWPEWASTALADTTESTETEGQ
ncbi:MAG: DUF1853 family protein [Natronospirillum sp.]|uniref:DUF1853 family protein n=1 Tax=Natronospirillum sp. TaxID=2812955 RepID=UPI0025E771D8|nr:DUF1853 family protein [Natronospirillum sp.]MCH8550649.1 DUF1853 family protein [Natronospirillum sp.]